MSDQRLRDSSAPGWPAAASTTRGRRSCAKRLRRGLTDEARLTVAAQLGHTAAAVVLGPRAPGRATPTSGCYGRARRRDRPRRSGGARARERWPWRGGASARGARRDERHARRPGEAPAPSRRPDWVRCPCADHALRADHVAEQAGPAVWKLRARTQRSAYFAVIAAEAAALPSNRPALRLEDAADETDDVRAALRHELVPWLLGHADPVDLRK
ncbi:MAG: hypothetical protein KIT58_00295 [Planctomycetota bacterium]|nr:hypothetical protein [Planctomycetota bacterium]